jgi:hypothetical protein
MSHDARILGVQGMDSFCLVPRRNFLVISGDRPGNHVVMKPLSWRGALNDIFELKCEEIKENSLYSPVNMSLFLTGKMETI